MGSNRELIKTELVALLPCVEHVDRFMRLNSEQLFEGLSSLQENCQRELQRDEQEGSRCVRINEDLATCSSFAEALASGNLQCLVVTEIDMRYW